MTNGKEDTRVRAIWRGIVPYCVGFGVQLLLIAVILVGIRTGFDESELGNVAIAVVEPVLLGVASALGLLLVAFIATRLDERSISAYGVAATWRDLVDWIAGLAIGGLMYAVPTVVFLQLGEAELTGSPVFPGDAPGVIVLAVVVTVGAFLFQVAFEEFAFRGVLLKNYAEGLSAWGVSRTQSVVLALLTSSVIFGFSHVIRQGGGGTEARSLQLVATSTLLGLLWGSAYVLTGRLAIPFGLHLGHNLWPALVLQPMEVTLAAPALRNISYSVSQYELTAGKVLVGGICLVVWLSVTRREVTIAEDVAGWLANSTESSS